MDAIEGEGINYVKREVQIETAQGGTGSGMTHVVKDPLA